MAGPNGFVQVIDQAVAERLQALLRDLGFEFREIPHAVFSAKGEDVNLTYYGSGKLVVQGKGSSDFRLHRLNDLTGPKLALLKERTIGCDESGKGDYFGPLVVAACALSPEEEVFLDEFELKDSKLLSDTAVRDAAEQLRGILPHEVLVIGPKRYNEMYESFKNLNRLLSWAHAKAMLALRDKTGCSNVLLDQFCDRALVLRALGSRAGDVSLTTQVRAEENPAVAAASILARSAFLHGLHRLKSVAGITLPKGAGENVLVAAKAIKNAHGLPLLSEVAKLHFKITAELD